MHPGGRDRGSPRGERRDSLQSLRSTPTLPPEETWKRVDGVQAAREQRQHFVPSKAASLNKAYEEALQISAPPNHLAPPGGSSMLSSNAAVIGLQAESLTSSAQIPGDTDYRIRKEAAINLGLVHREQTSTSHAGGLEGRPKNHIWTSAVAHNAASFVHMWAFQAKTEGMVDALDDIERVLQKAIIEAQMRQHDREAGRRGGDRSMDSWKHALDAERREKAELAAKVKEAVREVERTRELEQEVVQLKKERVAWANERQEYIDRESVKSASSRDEMGVMQLRGWMQELEGLAERGGLAARGGGAGEEQEELLDRLNELQMVIKNKNDDLRSSHRRIAELERQLQEEHGRLSAMGSDLPRTPPQDQSGARALEADLKARLKTAEEKRERAQRLEREAEKAKDEAEMTLRGALDEIARHERERANEVERADDAVAAVKNAMSILREKAQHMGSLASTNGQGADERLRVMGLEVAEKQREIVVLRANDKALREAAEKRDGEQVEHLSAWRDMANEVARLRAHVSGLNAGRERALDLNAGRERAHGGGQTGVRSTPPLPSGRRNIAGAANAQPQPQTQQPASVSKLDLQHLDGNKTGPPGHIRHGAWVGYDFEQMQQTVKRKPVAPPRLEVAHGGGGANGIHGSNNVSNNGSSSSRSDQFSMLDSAWQNLVSPRPTQGYSPRPQVGQSLSPPQQHDPTYSPREAGWTGGGQHDLWAGASDMDACSVLTSPRDAVQRAFEQKTVREGAEVRAPPRYRYSARGGHNNNSQPKEWMF